VSTLKIWIISWSYIYILFQEFQKAANDAKQLVQKPTDQELLDLYANYKQVTVGDCNTGMYCT
jgi:acyl-CoA-binding protein